MIESDIGSIYDRCVRFFGDRPALKQGDHVVTYRELGRDALKLAGALQARGIQKGHAVAFLMANCTDYVTCEYALAKIGAIRVPLATLLAPDDHVYMMNQAKVSTLFYHASMAERVLAMAPSLTTVESYICIGGSDELPTGHISLSRLMDDAGRQPQPVSIDGEDIAGIYFTGGTTGRPKGVMLSHRSWINTYLIEMLEFGFDWHETFLFATPLTHAGGCLLIPVLLRGGCCVILDHFEAGLVLESVERENITSMFLVPSMIYMLLDHPALASRDMSSLRNIIYGAAAIAPERLKEALQVFGPILTQIFGQTEAPMTISVLSRADHVVESPEREAEIFSSAGRPTFHTQIRLLDDENREVAEGEAGEIVVRCANVMSGYLDNPEATAEALRDGWLYTGDVGKFDDEGFLYIVDRKKDMVISGGFNIYPREIEDVLYTHDAVRDAAVVGVPHKKWGEEVQAVVVLKDGAGVTDSDLIKFVKSHKGSLVAPKCVHFWKALPLTNLGKIDKKTIREKLKVN